MPYRTALVPDARVAAIPPNEASAPGSTGKWSLCPDVHKMAVQLETRYACLDGGISVVLTNAEDAVHFVECDAERAFGSDNCAFNTGASAVGDDRYVIFRTDSDNIGDFGVGFWEYDCIGERAAMV